MRYGQCKYSTIKIKKARCTNEHLNGGLLGLAAFDRLFPRLLPLTLFIGVPLRLRDVVSVLLALVTLAASSCKTSKNKTKSFVYII